jgi:hypothetical protein
VSPVVAQEFIGFTILPLYTGTDAGLAAAALNTEFTQGSLDTTVAGTRLRGSIDATTATLEAIFS